MTSKVNVNDDYEDPFLIMANSNIESQTPINFSRPRRPISEEEKNSLGLSPKILPSSLREPKKLTERSSSSDETERTWVSTRSSQPPNIPDDLTIKPTQQSRLAISPPSQNNLSEHFVNHDRTPTRTSVPSSGGGSPNDRAALKQSPSPSRVSNPQSMLWDEVESIKRRVRQLELNATPPSVLSHNSIDRPLTGGTSISSSSPQRISPFATHSISGTSTTSTAPPQVAPILNQALQKARQANIASDILDAIERTAKDALALTVLAQESPGISSSSPRLVRRKAEGVCRGLADICIGLVDQQQFMQRQQSRQVQHAVEDARDSSPLTANTDRTITTLPRATARRLSLGTGSGSIRAPSVVSTTAATQRRLVNRSVVGTDDLANNDEHFDDAISVASSRPAASRFTTIQYRPSSRAATDIFRSSPPVREKQPNQESIRSLTNSTLPTISKRALTARHSQSSSEYTPTPIPSESRILSTKEDRRQSLNFSNYFTSPRRSQTIAANEYPERLSRDNTMLRIQASTQVTPPRTNLDRIEGIIRKRHPGPIGVSTAPSSVSDRPYGMGRDIDEFGRMENSVHRSLGNANDLRRTGSLTLGRATRGKNAT